MKIAQIRASKKSVDPGGFTKDPSDGLLIDDYQQEDHLSDALMKRRQKLATHKLGIKPEAEDA